MNNKLAFQRSASFLIYGIVTTIPLIFGAVHPIVLGVYVFVMLVGLGGWLLLNQESKGLGFPSFWTVVPVFLSIYLVLQSIPLSFDWVELLSPYRADRVRMVNELAGTNQQRITLSDNGIVGLYRSFFLLALMFYYFSLRRLLESDRKFYVTLLYCLVGVGTFEALYGLIQFVNPQIGILWLSIKARAAYGTIIYKNQYASLLNMLWPLAVAGGALYFIQKKQDRPRDTGNRLKDVAEQFSTTKIQAPLLVFAAGIMMLAILFSLSRGGILAMVLIALLLVFLLPFSRGGKIGFLVIFVCLVGGYGAMLGLDTIVSRFDTLDRSGANRIDIYLSSLPMLMDHMVTGIGIGSYTLLSPVYLKGFPANILYDRVHNEYLELMIELGIPVAISLFVWIFAGMLKLMFGLLRAMKRTAIGLNRIAMGTAAFCGLAGFLVHGFVDFGWRLPANMVYGVTLLAICASSLKSEVIQTNDLKDQNSGGQHSAELEI